MSDNRNQNDKTNRQNPQQPGQGQPNKPAQQPGQDRNAPKSQYDKSTNKDNENF